MKTSINLSEKQINFLMAFTGVAMLVIILVFIVGSEAFARYSRQEQRSRPAISCTCTQSDSTMSCVARWTDSLPKKATNE